MANYKFKEAEEIKRLRSFYDLSARSMSIICGFGENQWRKYEDGSVPSRSNFLIIHLIACDGKNFLRLLKLQKDSLSTGQYEKAIKRMHDIFHEQFFSLIK